MEVADHIVGAAFGDQEIAQLSQAYIDAQDEEEAPSRHNEVAIQAVLAKPVSP
ncbi:hypothetical protein [Dyella sp. RRB7]|uniref:hypothetical protein n=1 Tax=Dyella sp. RRB7 TaxID=2919502 RepID=UPI001FAA928C|nr:hypothetical protein [Dyella sp. RRB7]